MRVRVGVVYAGVLSAMIRQTDGRKGLGLFEHTLPVFQNMKVYLSLSRFFAPSYLLLVQSNQSNLSSSMLSPSIVRLTLYISIHHPNASRGGAESLSFFPSFIFLSSFLYYSSCLHQHGPFPSFFSFPSLSFFLPFKSIRRNWRKRKRGRCGYGCGCGCEVHG